MRLILVLLALIGFLSCTSHNEEEYFSNNNCSTENISFSETVFPLIENSCLSCHNSNNSSGGINLSNFESIKSSAQSGQLLGSIKHTAGYSPMPQFGEKLSDCTIAQVEAWIEQGMKNN
ncbi:MAG: hypothetical protein JW735_14450 [Prolixibacteraceae bacterium]|nr:hypothetical protein [Prolixibacteraceae bacterium]